MKKNYLLLAILIASVTFTIHAQEISLNHNGIVFPNLTTTERNAVTAELGMVIYNTTTDRFEFYNSLNWVPLDSEFVETSDIIEDGTDADTYVKAQEFAGSDYIIMKAEGASGSVRVRSGPAGDLRIETIHPSSANTFIGDRAGDATLADGTSNSFVGYQAGSSNTTGSNNSFFGRTCGFSNLDGSENTFLGRKAGYDNTTGMGNTFVGAFTAENGNNNFNTIIGAEAFQSLDFTTSQVVAVGYQAGQSADLASNSVLIGHQAGQMVDDGNNVFVGYQAGQNLNNTNGNMKDNVIIGYQAGQENDGSANVYIGKQAGTNNQGTGNIFIGNNAGSLPTNANNQLRITNGNTNLYEPLIYGELNTGLAGINNDSPNANFHIKQKGSGVKGLAIEDNTTSNVWALDAGSTDLFLSNDGSNVGSWDDVSGQYTAISDRNLKKSIRSLSENQLNKLMKLVPSTYYYKKDSQEENLCYGFIAQEVKEIFPEAVSYVDVENNYLGINYDFFSVIAIKAIQEQQEEIDLLKKIAADKDATTKILEERLRNLEKIVGDLYAKSSN